MKNAIVLGMGRSGTSMATAMLRNEPGIFFGWDLLDESPANPHGFYECAIINSINDMLIRRMVGIDHVERLPLPLRLIASRLYAPAHRNPALHWLACPRFNLTPTVPQSFGHVIRRATNKKSFCLKDPRFSNTLPVWRRYLPDHTRFMVLFREPHRVAESIQRDLIEGGCGRISDDWILRAYCRTYRRLVQWSRADRNLWHFASFESLLSGEGSLRIADFLDAKIDDSQIRQSVSRSRSEPAAETDQSRWMKRATEMYVQLQAETRA